MYIFFFPSNSVPANRFILTIRSDVTPFKIFAEYNSSKETSKDEIFLKEQFDLLTDIEKLFWIRKSVLSSSESEVCVSNCFLFILKIKSFLVSCHGTLYQFFWAKIFELKFNLRFFN